ncbi:hypothetical protein GCM10020254_03040 [Streptomyces goshikiensis]
MLHFMRAQAQMLMRSPQLFATLVVIPFYSLVFFHFLKAHHQGELATTTALTAFLMGAWSHAVFVASQAVDDDRAQGTLSLSLLTPTRYLLALATRTLLTTSLALPVLGEMFLVGRWVFGLPIRVERPGLTLLVAALVTAGVAATALLMSGLMILVRAARSLQNALTYPLLPAGRTDPADRDAPRTAAVDRPGLLPLLGRATAPGRRRRAGARTRRPAGRAVRPGRPPDGRRAVGRPAGAVLRTQWTGGSPMTELAPERLPGRVPGRPRGDLAPDPLSGRRASPLVRLRAAARQVAYGALASFQDYRAMFTLRTWLFGWTVRLICQVLFFASLGRLVGSPSAEAYLAFGNAAILGPLGSLGVVSSTVGERVSGTLEFLLLSRGSTFLVLASRGLHWMADGLLTSTIALCVVSPLLGGCRCTGRRCRRSSPCSA